MPCRAVRPLTLLLLLAFLPGCELFYRSKPELAFSLPSGELGAPYLSLFQGGDGVTDCAPSETEVDLGVMWRSLDNFSFKYEYRPIAKCTPTEGRSVFVQRPVETVFSQADDLAGCVLNFDFEGRLVGRHAFVAGLCSDNDNVVVALERTTANVWSPTILARSGQQIDGEDFSFALGTDAHWDGSKLRYALTYGDASNDTHFALFELNGMSWSASNIFGPGDIGGVAGYTAPRIAGNSPDTYVSFQTTATAFGAPAALYYSKIAETMTAQKIAELGDAVPGSPGETIASFGFYQSAQAGLTRGAFTATSTPSNWNLAYEYDVADSLSLTLRYKKDDPVPDFNQDDLLQKAAQWTFPSYDGDRLGLRVQLNNSRFAYVADTPNAASGTTAVGVARTLTDMYFADAITSTSVSNNAYAGGVLAYRAVLAGDKGSVETILLQDIESAEIARGGPGAIYGNDAVAGVVNFLTGPETGFDRIEKNSNGSNYGGATFLGEDLYLGNAFGVLYRWDEQMGDEVLIADTGISEGITGLTSNEFGDFRVSSADAFYSLDAQASYAATRIGYFETEGGAPISDISDIGYVGDTYVAFRLGGEIGVFDPATAVYTPRYQINGLPGDLLSGATDGERVFAGLSTGELVELLDCPPPIEIDFIGPPTIEEFEFGIIGRSGATGITALAIPAPEPSAALLGMAALATLGALSRRRSAGPRDRLIGRRLVGLT